MCNFANSVIIIERKKSFFIHNFTAGKGSKKITVPLKAQIPDEKT
jgi:hypothetical protein